MEVILRDNFPSLGYVGDVVRVKNGYARNFLIPRGIALEASSHNAKLLNHKMAGINARKAKLRAEAEVLGKKLGTARLEFTLKAGDGGKTFGSVSAKEVETALIAQGHQVTRTQIKTTEVLKRAGEFTVQVKLHADVIISVPVKITVEVPKKLQVEDDEADGERKAKRKSKKKVEGEEVETEDTLEAAPKETEAKETKTKEPKKSGLKKKKETSAE